MDAPKIGLAFSPANEGDFAMGLPARDLTEEEVAYYQEREPELMRNATQPHPTTGKALYTPVAAPRGKHAAASSAKDDE